MSTQKQTITLLISCPDQPGIVAAVSNFIFEHHGNILESDQHSTNQEDCAFFMRVNFDEEGFNLPATELEADQQRIFHFMEGKVDFLILARYMQILEPFLVNAYPHQIINIHHSFLPAFIGANPYQRAFERGVKLIGATAHYVTDSLDEGPIIAQDVIHCNHRDTVEDLIRKGRDVERRVLAEAVRMHTEDRVLVYENKTIVFE